MISRKQHIATLLQRLRAFPVVAIPGPRQIGKTTLAQQIGREYTGPTHWLDLESPADLNRLTEDAGARARRAAGSGRHRRGTAPA